MKALVYTANEEMTYRDEPEPVLTQSDESIVQIEAVGICGSDMHAYLGHDARRVPPLILGHEAVGKVVEGPLTGKRVVLNPLITCGACDSCLNGQQNLCTQRDLIGMYRPGAFAERIAIPSCNLVEIPDGMSAQKAALTEPGATGLHAILLAERSLTRPISEAHTLVIGGGSVGLLTALLLQDKGVVNVQIAETNPLRRATIEKYTNIEVFDPIANPAIEDHYDIVFDAVGGEHTRNAAISSIKPGGTVVHIGLMDNAGNLDIRYITLQEITFIGCYTYSPVDIKRTLEKLHSGALGNLEWVHEQDLQDGAQAFKDLLAGDCAAPKVVLSVY